MTVEEFLAEHGIHYPPSVRSYVLTCPICLHAKKLYIDKTEGNFKCFHCGDEFRGNKPDRALAAITGLDLDEVRLQLYGDAPRAVDHLNINLVDPYDIPEEDLVDDRPTVAFPDDFVLISNPNAKDGADYLAERGIPLAVALMYGIHYSLSQQRVIFPVEEEGRLIGWQGRAIRDMTYWKDGIEHKVPKMLGSKHTPLHKCLMFYDRLKTASYIILCEGPVDALKCHLLGGNVASMGKSVSDRQIEIINELPHQRVFIALDPDAGAEIERLTKSFPTKQTYLLLAPPPYKDLGEMPMNEVVELFEAAPRVFPGQVFYTLRSF